MQEKSPQYFICWLNIYSIVGYVSCKWQYIKKGQIISLNTTCVGPDSLQHSRNKNTVWNEISLWKVVVKKICTLIPFNMANKRYIPLLINKSIWKHNSQMDYYQTPAYILFHSSMSSGDIPEKIKSTQTKMYKLSQRNVQRQRRWYCLHHLPEWNVYNYWRGQFRVGVHRYKSVTCIALLIWFLKEWMRQNLKYFSECLHCK